MAQTNTQALLRQRLMSDIAELQQKPYPGIKLHIQDQNALQQACLILSPEGEDPLHLTVFFGNSYPFQPPTVTIQSSVSHPNVFDDYICASILNTEEGYTSAYTLKGICIQLLSFFSSDKIYQMHGDEGEYIDRREWQREEMPGGWKPEYQCKACGFGRGGGGAVTSMEQDATMSDAASSTATAKSNPRVRLIDLPAEVLLLICDNLDEEALLLAAKAWNGFGRVMRQYNIIRTRELQCFTLKEGFKTVCLGIGVDIEDRKISSEFDLLSYQAFNSLRVRRSVQGLEFNFWLPLPISQTHWIRAKACVNNALDDIARAANIRGPIVTVLYSFMNDIVVRLSKEAEDAGYNYRGRRFLNLYGEQKSTLTHASEKAIESYFHLYHLLLCLATERPKIAQDANAMITDFLAGKRDKQRVPNLGHLLIMVLISSQDATEELTKAIITEAITRNVVWMLDPVRGQNMPELSFLETDAVSDYRLQKTFEAGKTSYRLLMFASLMNRFINTTTSTGQRKTLAELRDDLFSRHGAPPNGAAAELATAVRKIQAINSFPQFLKAMGIKQMPAKAEFTTYLRRSLHQSVEKGYSKWALSQEEALALREKHGREPEVGRMEGMKAAYAVRPRFTFFPGDGRGGRR